MCWFITATLPSEEARTRLRPVIERYRLDFSSLANDYVHDQLAKGECFVRATHGHCDCGTELGFGHSMTESRAKWTGGNEEKIARWLEQSEATARDALRNQRASQEPQTPELDAWLAFLRDALGTGLKYVGLLIHYGDSMDQFRVLRFERAPIVHVDEAFLESMTPDVLYRFQAAAADPHWVARKS